MDLRLRLIKFSLVLVYSCSSDFHRYVEYKPIFSATLNRSLKYEKRAMKVLYLPGSLN